MRIYSDVFEMHAEEKRNLIEMGTVVHPPTMQDKHVSHDPGFATLELSPCVFTVLSGDRRLEWLESLGKHVDWAVTDFQERISPHGINPGDAWQMRPEWAEFLHDGKFAYTYSERFAAALLPVIRQLDENHDTRQAVLPVFNPSLDIQHLGGVKRVPCSMYYQFLRRRGELDCFYAMRSSDFHTHFPYDIFLAMELQAHIASVIHSPVGRFTFFSGSLHLYRKDSTEVVF